MLRLSRTGRRAVPRSSNCVSGFAASVGEKGARGRTAMKPSPWFRAPPLLCVHAVQRHFRGRGHGPDPRASAGSREQIDRLPWSHYVPELLRPVTQTAPTRQIRGTGALRPAAAGRRGTPAASKPTLTMARRGTGAGSRSAKRLVLRELGTGAGATFPRCGASQRPFTDGVWRFDRKFGKLVCPHTPEGRCHRPATGRLGLASVPPPRLPQAHHPGSPGCVAIPPFRRIQ